MNEKTVIHLIGTRKSAPAAFLRLLLPALLLCLTLAGCGRRETAPAVPAAPAEAPGTEAPAPAVVIGGREYGADAAEVTAVLAEGETALLDRLPALKSADLSGSENLREIAAWAAMHPGVDVTWTVPLPDGRVLDSRTETADLSALTGTEIRDAAEALGFLPALKRVELGAERSGVDWDDIDVLRAALPTVPFSCGFELYGTECNLEDTQINLSHVPVDDDGELLERVMDLMPQLTFADLDSCELPMWRCEEINLAHPDVKVVFRVWFGDNYTVRTDAEKILASRPTVGGELTPENTEGLYYCHDVRYLDVGHNLWLSDIGFVAEMPKLEVAVLAMCNWADAAPLSHCPELEYLEIFDTLCDDLTPLAGLQKLRHLNVCNIGVDQIDGPPRRLRDITPLYSLTKLERLWVGCNNDVPHEQVEEMRRRAPKCTVEDTVSDPTNGGWRFIDYDYINYMIRYPADYHPRYLKLIEQFEGEPASGISDRAYAFSWNDPLYY